jgi:hypothetical protein
LVILVGLSGFYPFARSVFVGDQAYPNFVYDIAKVQPPGEKLPVITNNGERGRIYTARSAGTVVLSLPTYSKRIGEVVSEVNAGEHISTTGRLAENGKWVEVRHKGLTGWIPNMLGSGVWTIGGTE